MANDRRPRSALHRNYAGLVSALPFSDANADYGKSDGATDDARSDRGRQLQRTMTGGALGGGALLVGFGLVPGVIGAAAGAILGYIMERRLEAQHPASAD